MPDQDTTLPQSCPGHDQDEIHDLCTRYIAEAASVPDPINSCPLHPQALLFERTMNGRLGCTGCLLDPFNLDASELPDTNPSDKPVWED